MKGKVKKMPKKKEESRNNYITQRKKELYDRLELLLPVGTKDRLKEVSSTMGISVNDYVGRLIKADLEADHKSEDLTAMLLKWQCKEKYHPMIESASYTKSQGYYIKLKKGFISDYSGTDEIICKTSNEIRHIMQLTHPVRTPEELGDFDSKTYEQLLRWQVPKVQFKNIEGVGDHEIRFKDGTVWKFQSVNELRYLWKSERPTRN